MKLINDEQKILQSDTGQLILTTHRVRFDASASGQRKIVSIMLDELCSCELNASSNILLILLAAVSAIMGLFGFLAGDLIMIPTGIVGAIVFAMAYLYTRRQALSLASAGATINVAAKGMKAEDIKDFIDAVEQAKFAIRK